MLLWFERSRIYPVFMSLVRMVSRSGDGYMQMLFPLLAAAFSSAVGGHFFAIYISAFAIERLLYLLLKNTLRRQRPSAVVPHIEALVKAFDKFSLPSGHTMAAFLLAAFAVIVFGKAAAIVYVWAVLVGVSRVILGVHYPSDIILGAILGSAIGYIAAAYL
ncbi:undecaprenyl-diphosphatase [Sinobacterium caligoides]|uniref:undecaprenyl-diphosphate phosphatase n=2 Tax=Sinobacterium caligoides TaxID=933926 RepID=A0A3N2DN80_9GAMM|nr:undecaprenyl-diphosphatase [Sinobacterium caligoides]